MESSAFRKLIMGLVCVATSVTGPAYDLSADETRSILRRGALSEFGEAADSADLIDIGRDFHAADLEPAALASTPCAACDTGNCPCCADCSLVGWVTVDYLHWWLQGDQVPALVTSSPDGTPRADAGVLGLPTTTVLFGQDRLSDDGRPGVRLGLGRWLDDYEDSAVGLEFFWVNEDPERFSASSQGDPALARPFFNTDPGVNAEAAELVAFDDPMAGDILDGAVSVTTSGEIYSAAPFLQQRLSSRFRGDRGYRVDLIGGYRFLRINESLRIGESLLVTESGGAVAQDTTFEIFDEFGTSNEFHGGEIGLKTHTYRGPWTLDVLAKLAIGNSHQRVRINGQTTVTVPSVAPLTRTGGLLAQSTNIGTLTNDETALLPELQLNLGWRVTPCTTLRVGYTLLYLTEAVRPGRHIDRNVDGRFLDPLAPPFVATNPAVAVDSTSVWLQGINLGVETVW